MIEESSAESYEMHTALLSKGFALDHAPTVQQALDGAIPFACQSQERIFLKNLVNCAADTAGGRLARWLQPESYVDVDKCRLSLDEEEFRWVLAEKVLQYSAIRLRLGCVIPRPHPYTRNRQTTSRK